MDKLTPCPIPTIRGDVMISDALEALLRSGRNKLLVVDEAGRLKGVMTPVDLLGREPR
jgi:CBS domain-containing protein